MLTNTTQIRNLAIHRLDIPVPQNGNPLIDRKSLLVIPNRQNHITRSVHTSNIHRFICNSKTGSIRSIIRERNGERARHVPLMEELRQKDQPLLTNRPPSTSTTQKSRYADIDPTNGVNLFRISAMGIGRLERSELSSTENSSNDQTLFSFPMTPMTPAPL